MNKFNVRKSLLGFSGLALVVIVFSVFYFSTQNNKPEIILENVTCNSCRINKIVPFELSEDSVLSLELSANVGVGTFSFALLSNQDLVIYSKSGNELKEKVSLELEKGVWYWQVQVGAREDKNQDANSVQYSILGKIL